MPPNLKVRKTWRLRWYDPVMELLSHLPDPPRQALQNAVTQWMIRGLKIVSR